jgi:ATP-dependent DNA helicase RecG
MPFPLKESNRLEFKEELPSRRQILKTVVAFSNLHGGRLMIGIRDDGEVVGFKEDPQDLMERLSQMVYDGCSPTLIPRFHLENHDGKQVVVLEVSPGTNKPYRLKNEENGVYVRVGNTTLKATPDIVEELHWQTQRRSFDSMPRYGVQCDELNQKAILDILRRKRIPDGRVIPTQMYTSLQLHHTENGTCCPSNAAVLLFHPNPQVYFSEAFTICTVFKGTSGRDIIKTQDCEGPILEQLEQVYSFLLRNLEVGLRVDGSLQHTQRHEIPIVAIREALINAFVHRNYNTLAPVKVAIYDDRLEIFSPGEFPGPIDPDHIAMGVTYLRNPVLARWFREAGHMEKLGSGLPTIFRLYREAELSPPSVGEVQRNVKVVLPRTRSTGLGDEDRILSLLQSRGPLSISSINDELTQLSRATLGRKLKAMVKDETILSEGKGRALRYSC